MALRVAHSIHLLAVGPAVSRDSISMYLLHAKVLTVILFNLIAAVVSWQAMRAQPQAIGVAESDLLPVGSAYDITE